MAESGENVAAGGEKEAEVLYCRCGGVWRKDGKSPRNGIQKWECKSCGKKTTCDRPEVEGDRVEGPGVGVLRALRTVLLNPERHDRGEEERLARRWMREDPDRFFDRKSKLEKEEREEMARKDEKDVQVVVKRAEVGVDEAGIRELIRDLLAEMRKPEVV